MIVFNYYRIKYGLTRIHAYEDPSVQEKLLSILPLSEIELEAKANCREESSESNLPISSLDQLKISGSLEKPKLSYRDELVRSLLKWYKYSFFTWCNKPLCSGCKQTSTDYVETQIPSAEEALWAASRTEVYKCSSCNILNRFPRYNNPIKLCETKTGRCGEWANLFGAILRALKYEVRFVDNFEDHVWNEYYSEDLNCWIHVDSCENAWNTPLVYEQGWGRIMTFILAHSITGIQEVTPRYIKDYDIVMKRKNPKSMDKLRNLLMKQNQELRKNFGQISLKNIRYRDDDEIIKFNMEKYLSKEELIERQSGSEEWRKSRGEMK